MPTFIGFNTINQYKKFTLVDFALIKRDLLNYLNIRQGEKVGRPDVGTTMWNLVFEPQTESTAELVIQELQRIVGQDPRIYLTKADAYPQVNGILVELEIQTVQGQNAERLSVFFDQQTRTASYV
jgi:phage baseplate assembly protein W